MPNFYRKIIAPTSQKIKMEARKYTFREQKFLVTSTSCENGQHNNTLNKPFQKSNREGVISYVQNQVLLSKMQSIYAERRT